MARKASAYIHYLPNPEQHTNGSTSHAGIGATKEEAIEDSLYWANQTPWCQTVPISRAPQWAVDEAEDYKRHPIV